LRGFTVARSSPPRRAEEAEVACKILGGRTLWAKSQDRHSHRKIVADRPEQFIGYHGKVPWIEGVASSKIGNVDLLLPVRLNQDTIDQIDIHRPAPRGPDRFEHRGQAEVAALA